MKRITTVLKGGFLSLLFLLFTNIITAEAASRYWIATSTANWSNTANWSTSSGGSGGATVPGSSDYAYFNSSRNGNCTIDETVTFSSLSREAALS
jgi:hypothetical protein